MADPSLEPISVRISRPTFIQLALVAATLALFVVGGHVAAMNAIDQQRTKQLQELTEVALRRAEVAVDFGAKTLNEVANRGPLDCDASALQAVRLQVYQRSAVKDIRSVNRDGSVICSAYSETLEFDAGWVNRTDMLPALAGNLLLFRVDQIGGFALGVLRDIDEKKSLVAILGIDSYVFDIMPAELRQHSEVKIELNNGLNVGQFSTLQTDALHPSSVSFFQDSARYPLHAAIKIDSATLKQWNNEGYWPAIALATALGVLFGVLLAKNAARSNGPLADMDRGLRRREFKPFYQPTFDLKTGAIVGCEVLARWVKSNGSIVPPTGFIPLAESSGRIESMTWQILELALGELAPRLKVDKAFKVSFNIAPQHLLSENFVDTLRRIVLIARISPRQIVLELTERDELPDLEKAAERIADLRASGFRVAMDDVGVGHSGLSQIKVLGANTIKIDKFFVDTITRDNSAFAIVEMLVRLARELEMSVIAEGIETSEQLASLVSCGVEEGQGYIVSPPVPFAKFDELLDKHLMARSVEAIVKDAALVA